MASISISGWSGTDRSFTLEVWENSVDVANNKSNIGWRLTASGGGGSWFDTYLKAVVNGSVVWNETCSWDKGSFPAADGSKSGSFNVSHNADGTKSVPISIEGYCYVYSTKSNSGTLKLTNIDRTAPNVGLSINEISTDKIEFNATSNVNCDQWQYQLNGGAWITFSTTSGKSASKTIENLEVNTFYRLKIRARKASNQLYGSSEEIVVQTLGGAAYISDGRKYKKAITFVVTDDLEWKAAIPYIYTLDGWKQTIF